MPNTPAELDLIERFLNTYNIIDAHLQSTLGNGSPGSFRSAVDAFAKTHRWWRDAELLRTAAGLRNLLVHEKTQPYQYPCVPTAELVSQLEAACDRLLHPRRALPQFGREVVTVQPEDSLAHVLKLIHASKFTHFPVYDYSKHKPRFAGVLTENGITRWLANHISKENSLVELKDEPVREVLALEESVTSKRRNYEFVSKQKRVEEIVYRFHENTYLETVLITPGGHEDEKLLGIVTRWDALHAH